MQSPANPHPCGTLYLVATPIGNLSDLSERAVRALKEVDFIAAEDTRVTRKLTAHLGIKKSLISYRAHNQLEVGERILARVLSGESCALVTDAGTPGISDPGEDLVRLFARSNVPMVMIPGPCAAIAGLVLSGFPTGRFVFEGFLPTNKRSRLARLEDLKTETRTLVFYEAPHKLIRTLTDMLDVLGNRSVSISREMTKIYEETLRFSLSEAVAHFSSVPARGEFVLVIEGADSEFSAADAGGELDKAAEMAAALIESGLSARDAVRKAALDSGCSRNELYKVIMNSGE